MVIGFDKKIKNVVWYGGLYICEMMEVILTSMDRAVHTCIGAHMGGGGEDD